LYIAVLKTTFFMKRIALKFASVARIKAASIYQPHTGGQLDFSGSPLGANPPTA